MKSILPDLIEDARNRGDLYAESILQMHGGSCAELANDSPARARDGLRILERWSNTGFHVEHLVELHNQVEIALYLGNGREALDLVTKRWSALRSSHLMKVQAFNIQMRSLRSRAALSAAAAERSSAARMDLLRAARSDAEIVAREGTLWGAALAEIVLGCAEHLSNRRELAIARLASAQELFHKTGMLLHETIVRRCRGSIIGGEEGKALASSADSILRSEGIADPDRFTVVIAPGLAEREL